MGEARATLCWQFGQDRLDRLNPCLIHNKREQIRVWKITVIVRKLLATHGTGNFSVRIPQAGFLDDPEGIETRDDEPEEVERAYQYVLADPKFRVGTQPSGPLSLEAKRFIVEMYERFTGKRLLE